MRVSTPLRLRAANQFHRSSVLLGLVLSAAVLAGCVSPAATTSGAPTPLPSVNDFPKLDAKKMLVELKAFAEKFPERRGDNQAHKDARAYLMKGYTDAGYKDVFLDDYTEAALPDAPGGSAHRANVCAMHWGTTNATEWIVVGAHFDVTSGAVYGTYDDGSGTFIVQYLARAFATVPTARTIVFCNFDGEEEGLRGSSHMFKSVVEGSWKFTNGTVVGDEDFDMAGINYPAAPPLVADVRSPEMKATIEKQREALKMPNGTIQYRAVTGGSSDNGPFKAGNIPSVLFISDFDDVRAPGPASDQKLPGQNYPFWHRMDTYEGMVQLAGSEDNLVKGTQNVNDIGSALLMAMASPMTLTFV